MQILTTNDLPAIWAGDEGGYKANDLARPIFQLLTEAAEEIDDCLAQLGTANDLSPDARSLAVELRQQLAEAHGTAFALGLACRPA